MSHYVIMVVNGHEWWYFSCEATSQEDAQAQANEANGAEASCCLCCNLTKERGNNA